MTHAELTALLQHARDARRLRPTVPLALATLVAVDGSSYRQPGARMLCDAEGRVLAGAISGGCLEGDVALRAAEVCATGTGVLVSYDLRNDLEAIWGFGTGCDGVAHILLAPFPATSALHEAHVAAEARLDGTLFTVVQCEEPALIGTSWFHSGHPELEMKWPAALSVAMRDEAVRESVVRDGAAHVHATVRRTGRPFLDELRLSGSDNSASAGGLQLFGAPVLPAVQLLIVGASRGAEAFARVAQACGWRVVVVDHRPEALDALALPEGVSMLALPGEEATEALQDGRLRCDERTAIAVCTHRFELDLQWIAAAMRTGTPYVGVLGSRQRAARLLRSLGEGESPLRARDRARLFAPIGLDIGGESPEEIALAAVAEVQAAFASRPGGSLRERRGPLHTRTDTPQLPADRTPAACPADTPRPRR